MADFNGDGKADILWRNVSTGANAIWLMSGFSVAAGAFIPTLSTAGWTISGVGDYNTDSKADILWRNTSTGATAIWLMNGFSVAAGALLPAVPTNWRAVATD